MELIKGRKLHFVCLTHPHADHGVDLVPILEQHPEIGAFWSTIFELPAFIYGVEQTVNFPSPVRDYAKKMNQDWAEFLFDILASVISRGIPRHCLRADLASQTIDGVEVHCISPEETMQQEYFSAYKKKLTNPLAKVPDPNLISAVLALKFGESLILLGADALKANWRTAVAGYRKRGLPKAVIVKVPHHGARNAMDLQGNAGNYLDICSHQPKAKAVIFAGDSRHPDLDVFAKLRARTDTICLSNGQKQVLANSNPLNFSMPGARVVAPAPICNPVVGFEVDESANVTSLSGVVCGRC